MTERGGEIGPPEQQAPDAQVSLDLTTLDGPADERELMALVEALLLAAPAPATISDLALGAGVTPDRVEAAMVAIDAAPERGWLIQRHAGAVQLVTAPRFAPYIRRFLRLDREAKLLAAALETLAIVGYQQPVTRAEVEAVRGVDSSGVLATLLSRGLIEVVGRQATAGNPFQYGTTPAFLLHFGLKSLDDLPPLGRVGERDVALALKGAIAAADDDATNRMTDTDASTD